MEEGTRAPQPLTGHRHDDRPLEQMGHGDRLPEQPRERRVDDLDGHGRARPGNQEHRPQVGHGAVIGVDGVEVDGPQVDARISGV